MRGDPIFQRKKRTPLFSQNAIHLWLLRPAPRVGTLSDDARLTPVAYIGPKSRTERLGKTKIGRGSPRHTWLGHHFQGQKVKRSKVNLQGRCILWRPPAQLVVASKNRIQVIFVISHWDSRRMSTFEFWFYNRILALVCPTSELRLVYILHPEKVTS